MRKCKLNAKTCSLHLLNILLKLKGDDLNELFNHLSEQCVNRISECLWNLIYGQLPATKSQKRRLRKLLSENLVDFKFVTNGNVSVQRRRTRLKKMTGAGSLNYLLSFGVPILRKIIQEAQK